MKSKILFFILLSTTLFTACVNDPKVDKTPVELPPLEDDYEIPSIKWGYMNKSGKLVIETKFDDARDFKEDFALSLIHI